MWEQQETFCWAGEYFRVLVFAFFSVNIRGHFQKIDEVIYFFLLVWTDINSFPCLFWKACKRFFFFEKKYGTYLAIYFVSSVVWHDISSVVMSSFSFFNSPIIWVHRHQSFEISSVKINCRQLFSILFYPTWYSVWSAVVYYFFGKFNFNWPSNIFRELTLDRRLRLLFFTFVCLHFVKWKTITLSWICQRARSFKDPLQIALILDSQLLSSSGAGPTHELSSLGLLNSTP